MDHAGVVREPNQQPEARRRPQTTTPHSNTYRPRNLISLAICSSGFDSYSVDGLADGRSANVSVINVYVC